LFDVTTFRVAVATLPATSVTVMLIVTVVLLLLGSVCDAVPFQVPEAAMPVSVVD
jgi:hypothetical protein